MATASTPTGLAMAGPSPEDADADAGFEAAAAAVGPAAAGGALGTEALLALYGLFKQATAGPCTTHRPSFLDRRARAKWVAWKELGQLTAEEAKRAYVLLATEELLRAGLDPPQGKASEQGTPLAGPVFSSLMNAAVEGDEGPVCLIGDHTAGVAEALNDGGASVDDQDDDGCTALHWAADRGHLRVLELLIQAGADMHAIDSDRQTPLHYAALCSQRQACLALLRAGASEVTPDVVGQTARDLGPSDWDIWKEGND